MSSNKVNVVIFDKRFGTSRVVFDAQVDEKKFSTVLSSVASSYHRVLLNEHPNLTITYCMKETWSWWCDDIVFMSNNNIVGKLTYVCTAPHMLKDK